MKMQDVTKLRIGDVVRFQMTTSTDAIDEVQVVTKKWSQISDSSGYSVTTTGYPITPNNCHLFTKIA